MGQASRMAALCVVPHHGASCCTPQWNGLCFNCWCFWLPTHPPFRNSQGWVASAVAGLEGTVTHNLLANPGGARSMVKQGKGRRFLP